MNESGFPLFFFYVIIISKGVRNYAKSKFDTERHSRAFWTDTLSNLNLVESDK